MKWLNALGAAAAAVAVALVIWLIVANDVANRRLIAVEKAWAEAPGALDDFVARYPGEETNEAAHRLEEAAALLDIDLKPRSEILARASTEASRRANHDLQVLKDYLDAELANDSGVAGPPSSEAVTILDRQAPHLGVVKQALAEGEPRWRMEIERGFEARIPNLLGQIQLHRILLASALREASRKDASTAQSLLEASWALNAPLLARPETISQLIAVAVARMQVGVVRKVAGNEDLWRSRLSSCDPRKGLVASFSSEAWALRNAIFRRVGIDGNARAPSPWRRPIDFLADPYLRIQTATLLETLREFILTSTKAPVGGDAKEVLEEAAPRSWSFSAIMARMMLPDMAEAWKRVDRLIVDLELTRKVLELRAARGTAREWPAALPGVESSVVKDARWVYSRTPDGHASIELSRRLEWGKTFGLVLPTRWLSAN